MGDTARGVSIVIENLVLIVIIINTFYSLRIRSFLWFQITTSIIINGIEIVLHFQIMLVLLKIMFIVTVILLSTLLYLAILDMHLNEDVDEEVYYFPDTDEDSDSVTDRWHEGMRFDDDSDDSDDYSLSREDSGYDDDFQDAQ